MDELTHDLRYALRQIARRPGFSLLAIFVVALGIGAATTIFSVLDTLVIRSLPYEDSDRIVTIWESNGETGVERDDVAPANFLDWRQQAESFEHLAALDPHSLDFTGGERPEVIFAANVSEGFFDALGTTLLHGRTFLPEEFEPGSAQVVILSEGLWQRRFGGDTDLVGGTLQFDGEPYTVVGILPRSFNPYLHPSVRDREAWIPLDGEEWHAQTRGSRWWNVVAKLKPGVSLAAAQAEMDAISSRLAEDYPATNASIRANIVPLRDHLVGNTKTALLVLQAAVGFLLLISCANVVGLFLARGTERESEFAVRAALGAGRARLARQLFTEAGLVAILGAALGIAFAYWSVELIATLGPGDVPRLDEVRVDGRVLTFAIVLSGITALLAGAVPSLHFSRPDLRSSMSEGRTTTAGSARQRVRSGLVVAEVAMSLVLVVGAGLLTRSFVSLLSVDPGFEKDRIAVVQIFRYAEGELPEERRLFFSQALEGMRALPGVRSAAAISAVPFIEANISIQQPFHVEGRAQPRPEDTPNAFLAIAAPDYFRTMGIPLLEGRGIERTDAGDAPRVAVITESLARRHWPGESPLRHLIRIGEEDGWQEEESGEPIVWEIVGVVGHVRHDGLDRDPRPEVFIPLDQYSMGSMSFVASTDGDPAALLDPMQEEVWALDPMQTVYRAATLDELISKSVAARRFNLWLLVTFAVLALVLAAVGIYGVVSYSTRARTHEFGIRMALGADQSEVLREAMGRGLRLTVLGVGLGLAGSLGLTRLLQGLLFGVSARDPITFLVVGVLLVAVALAATYLPARRATLVDPAVALRVE